MNRKDTYVQQLEEQLEDWISEIDTLTESAHKVDGEARVEQLQTVDRLRAQQEIARHKLLNLQKADAADWQDLKAGIDIAWRNLGNAIRTAADRLS